MASFIWFILMVVLLIAEAIAPGLTTIWFAGGALAAMLLSFFEVPVFMQIIFFIQVSFVLLYLTRPLVKKFQQKPKEKTNCDALVGRCGRVTEVIDNEAQTGQVNLEGQIWTARSCLETVKISEGCRVIVEQISGVKLIVREVSEELSVFEKAEGVVSAETKEPAVQVGQSVSKFEQE